MPANKHICHDSVIHLPGKYRENWQIRSKIRPKNGFFCYVPFLGLIFWVTFCSNSNTLTFDSKVYMWNNISGEKFIVIVSLLPLVGAHTKICPKY